MIKLLPGLLLVCLMLLMTGTAKAAGPQGEIRLQPAREGPVWVGQELELNLDLLSDGFSFSGQQFALPEISGAYLLQGDSSTVKLNERRGDESWQGLRYTFLMYPQRAGKLEIPAFQVQFSASAGYGKEAASFNFTTPPLVIEAAMPPGADPRSLVVTSTSFTMESEWNPGPDELDQLQLKTGDALKLEVQRSASAVPGMVFPPLPDFEIEGLRAYYDAPRVNDKVNRGALIGSRSESITFICERPGQFDIPAIKFQWWDPVNEVMNEKLTPGLTLEVIANPAYLPADGKAPGSTRRSGISMRSALTALIALLLLSLGGWQSIKYLKLRQQMRRVEREAGEAWAFEQVLKACSADAAGEAYRAINVWLTRCERIRAGLTLLQLAHSLDDSGLVGEAEQLQEAVLAGDGAAWNGKVLGQRLEKWRNHFTGLSQVTNELPPLNPV